MKMFLQLFFLLFFVDALYSQHIKSIQLKPLHSVNNYSAIVRLGTVLELSFDDLEADNKDYYYKIEHMTYHWKPSNLISSQYIDGFEQNNIVDISNSFNTLQPYTHYSVRLPNSNTAITKSGNYLISVLDQNYKTVFTRKCVFYESLSTVGLAVFRGRTTASNNAEQTVQFKVSHSNLHIASPQNEIKAVLLQNNDWNTVIKNIAPVFIQPNILLYNHTLLTNFEGNNEFLNFDTKRIRSTGLNIAKIKRDELYHSYLFNDKPRALRGYTYNPDINGQFVINTLDADIPETEADYTVVHFSLSVEQPYQNKDVFVYGAFNNFKLKQENKMSFNPKTNSYHTAVLLKQGFYNYTYAVVDSRVNNYVDNYNIIDLKTVGGSYFETENEYTAIIYYKPLGGFYDRVIGVGNGFFNQNK
ncbi:MAG: DUF5103 domain-containing protein [Tenacibaculum sp.]